MGIVLPVARKVCLCSFNSPGRNIQVLIALVRGEGEVRDHSLFIEEGELARMGGGGVINPGDSKRGHHEIHQQMCEATLFVV